MLWVFQHPNLRLERLVSFSNSDPAQLWLNLLGGACVSLWAGPLKRSRKESGRSVSSLRLFWAHSLKVMTMLTILQRRADWMDIFSKHQSSNQTSWHKLISENQSVRWPTWITHLAHELSCGKFPSCQSLPFSGAQRRSHHTPTEVFTQKQQGHITKLMNSCLNPLDAFVSDERTTLKITSGFHHSACGAG